MPVNQAGSETWMVQVRLRIANHDEATMLHSQLRGAPLWTGSSWCHISVCNPLLPVWASSSQSVGEAGPVAGRHVRRCRARRQTRTS